MSGSGLPPTLPARRLSNLPRGPLCSTAGIGDRPPPWQTIADLQREVERTGRDVLWFELDGRQYVLHDEASVRRANDIVEPMNRLGREQGRLGRMQGQLGRQQGELGALQGRLGGLEGRLARLEALDDPDLRQQVEELRTEVREVAGQMGAFRGRQHDLGAQQQALGARQRELGAQQRLASSQAQDQLLSLARSAVDSGKAEPLGDR